MQLLRVIDGFDPTFGQKLEEVLLKAAPRLHEVENELIPHLLMGVPLETLTFEECVKEVIKAMEAVPNFTVERQQLDYDGNEVGDGPLQVFSWTSREIARDRFGYLEAIESRR